MRIHIIYDTPGWARYNLAKSLQKYAPTSTRITHSTRLNADARHAHVILNMNFHLSPKYYPKRHKSKFVTNIDVSWPTVLIQDVKDAFRASDYVVINNRQLYRYLGEPPNCSVIEEGVDLDLFYDEGKPRRDIALWCSSEFHKTLKGYDLAQTLPFVECLVSSSYQATKSRDEMREWYNTAKVFLVLSDSDGTPNPGLESAACGCVPISTPVGVMPSLIVHGFNGFLVAKKEPIVIKHYFQHVLDHYETYQANIKNTIDCWSWQTQAQKYFNLFEAIL